MSLKEFFEQQRQERLALESSYLASIRSSIKSYERDLTFWSENLENDADGLCKRMVIFVTRQLENARHECEKYRVRIAKLHEFDIVRPDLH